MSDVRYLVQGAHLRAQLIWPGVAIAQEFLLQEKLTIIHNCIPMYSLRRFSLTLPAPLGARRRPGTVEPPKVLGSSLVLFGARFIVLTHVLPG